LKHIFLNISRFPKNTKLFTEIFFKENRFSAVLFFLLYKTGFNVYFM